MTNELHSEDGSRAERFWEDHYRGRERVWSGRPNPVLVDVVGSLRPGTALDLGCGEGGDAIWLARQGWRVTAVDVSATAPDRRAGGAAGRPAVVSVLRPARTQVPKREARRHK